MFSDVKDLFHDLVSGCGVIVVELVSLSSIYLYLCFVAEDLCIGFGLPKTLLMKFRPNYAQMFACLLIMLYTSLIISLAHYLQSRQSELYICFTNICTSQKNTYNI